MKSEDNDDLDPATEAKEKYKDPAQPVAGASDFHELHDRILDVRDESA